MKAGVLLAFLFSMAVYAATVTAELPADMVGTCYLPVTRSGVVPQVSSAYPGAEEGFPSLPELPWTVHLPAGEKALSVTSSATWETIAEKINIPPLPSPMPLILDVEVTSPRAVEEIYSSDSFWPLEPAKLTGTGFRNGLPEAEILVTPLRWNPVTGELQKLVSLEIRLETAPLMDRPFGSEGKDENFKRMLIVTDSSLEAVFQLLADRRTDQGILTEVITMDAVYSTSSGRDDAEKLRNFVKDYYTVNGLDFLLLGGDTDLVPFRYAYAMTCEGGFHSREDSLPCDLYFSDLDGTWDANMNDIFGEVADDVDLHPDIFVGRATVENITEAQIFVNNIGAYEECFRDDFYQDVLFLAEVLWTNPYTNSGESKDYIDEHFLPNYLNITKLYQALGNENLYTTLAALNEGQNLINHDGHAWYSTLGVGDGYMDISDVNGIDSDGRFSSVMYSIGCWSAAFDFDAIAEHFITNASGGCVNYVGNSSYGWGSPGNPLYGYSDALDHLFFDYLYGDWSLTLGELLAYTKEYFIPYSQWENVYRWHQYDVNLLGDPSFRPYRNNPVEIGVLCPDIITANTSIFPVQITGIDPAGLTVCVHDDGDYWSVVELNATGQVNFIFTEPVTGNVTLTVTGPGIRRTSIEIEQASGPDPVISQLLVDDTSGFGHLSPGCSADLGITLLNQGNENLTDVVININSISGPGTLTQNSSSFGSIAAGSETTGSPQLTLTVDASVGTGSVVTLNGQIVSSQGNWDLSIPLLVYAPGLFFTTYSVDDEADGNNNGIPEPGETFQLDVNIANLGLLTATEVTVQMTEFPAWVSWPSDSAWVDSIPEDDTRTLSFVCELSSSAPSPSFPWFHFDITSETTGYETEDTLRLTVGETGISNDVESGASGWTHSGTNDLWNITDSSSHSPSHSWYCGGAGGYVNNMDCGLLSPELTLAPDASMEFWTTFDVAIYGSDGIYLIIHDLTAGTADTLDFIGSGGALGGFAGKGNGTGWVPFSYDLSMFEAGAEVQIEFRFKTDNDDDTGTGFFIDDITIEGAYTGYTGTSGGSPEFTVPMGAPFPNPSHESVSVHLFSEIQRDWTLGLYDISGRLVSETTGSSPINSSVSLNVSDLAPGVYFLRFSAETETSRKLVILR
ncbi:MAG: T9SS type A sorting domain-containing protein [Candidatus Sabulitectum sp.]|nr:T9SS type A sorting domain-containing protein [Candidatus Sabulitectum sp.]